MSTIDPQVWPQQRQYYRQKIWQSLAQLPPLFTPQVQVAPQLELDTYYREDFMFLNSQNDQVYGYCLIPKKLDQPAPAILYNHFHGNRYSVGKDELFFKREFSPPIGQQLAEAGYIVLTIDAYAFGQRSTPNLGSVSYAGRDAEQALFKKFLWEGQTLWGMMLHDDLLALNYLISRPDVEAERVATMGMSMGGSRATWLAALDERIKVVIPVAQMTRYRDFADSGQYNLHGIYYYVPNFLAQGLDMEHLVALTAPRPQLIMIGDSDPLSPISGVQTIEKLVAPIYQQYGAADQFEIIIYENMGHQFTQNMVNESLDWLVKHL